MPTERLMLLDGYGLVYRGYYALPPLTTSHGELVNGVFGFASIVLRGIADLQPDYLAVSFDLPGKTFRHDQYAEYKATRQRMPDDLRDQFPKVREVVKALRIPVYEMQGYEADDVIGTITRQLEPNEDLETTIVTVDLDMLQLVTPRTRLMTTRSGVENTVMYDMAKIDERFGLRPDQMVDYKALKGDPTDNIPGVPGVGEKTAAKLIRDFGNLEGLFARLDEVTPEKLREKLREHHDQIDMGRHLSQIVTDLPIAFDLEAARLSDYDRDTVVRLFREYEFRTLIERLPPMQGETAQQRSDSLRSVVESGYVPAARVAGRPEGWSATRGPARPAGGELQLRLDFDAVAPASSGSPNGSDGSGVEAGRYAPAEDLPTPSPPRSWIPAGSRSAAPTASTTWLTGSLGTRRWAWRSSPTIRARVGACRLRSRSPDPTAGLSRPMAPRHPTRSGASCSGSGRRWSVTRSSPSSSPRSPTIPHRRRCRSRSTPRSPRTSSMRRCAARRSPTSSPRTSTRSCPRPTSCRPRHAPDSRRCRPSPFASRWSDGSPRSSSIACSRRSSCR